MLKKKDLEEINTEKINEVVSLSSKVMKIVYLLLIVVSIYVIMLLLKETKVLWIIGTIFKIVLPLFIGLVIAWLFDPLVRWFERRKIKRIFGVLITYVLILGVALLIIMTLVPVLANQITELAKIAPDIFETLKTWTLDSLNYFKGLDYIDAESIKDEFLVKFQNFAEEIGTQLPNIIINFFSALFSGIGTIVLGLVIGLFLLVGFDSAASILNLIPKKYRKTGIELASSVNDSLRKYVKGVGIDCSVMFIFTFIGFWAIGLQAPALFAFFCAVTNLIPYLGILIGAAPAVIVGFTQSPAIGLLALAVVCVVHFFEGNFFQPYILSKTTKVHPVTIMLGLLVFGYFFGIVGMLISTPCIAIIKTIFQFYDKKYGLLDYTAKEVEPEVKIEVKKVPKPKKEAK